MAGGIQIGTTAYDEHSKKLDNQMKIAREEVARMLKEDNQISYAHKLNKNVIPGGKGACAPDGGVWFYNGVLIAVFEGKKQNNKGNAIERWFKNYYICKSINSKVDYVTFIVGEGAAENGIITTTLNVAHLKGFNKHNINDTSCFSSVNGFETSFIIETMYNIIKRKITNE